MNEFTNSGEIIIIIHKIIGEYLAFQFNSARGGPTARGSTSNSVGAVGDQKWSQLLNCKCAGLTRSSLTLPGWVEAEPIRLLDCWSICQTGWHRREVELVRLRFLKIGNLLFGFFN